MKVILNQDVPSLGSVGDTVNVKNGYARNFLFPRSLAVLATEKNKSVVELQKKKLEKEKVRLLAESKKLATLIEKTSVTVTKRVGDEEKIFGSVTTAELEDLLAQEGIKVDKRHLFLIEDIKKVGVYTAEARLHPEVIAKFKVWVVAQ